MFVVVAVLTPCVYGRCTLTGFRTLNKKCPKICLYAAWITLCAAVSMVVGDLDLDRRQLGGRYRLADGGRAGETGHQGHGCITGSWCCQLSTLDPGRDWKRRRTWRELQSYYTFRSFTLPHWARSMPGSATCVSSCFASWAASRSRPRSCSPSRPAGGKFANE